MASNGKPVATILTAKPQETTQKSSYRQAVPQILAVMVKNVLLLAYGLTVGYPTILIPGLSGQDPNEKFRLNEEQLSWIGSINMMCVPIGCLLSGIATHPIGRKRAMQIVNFPLIMCWLIFRYAAEVWHVYMALALTGLFGGLLEAPVLTYVSEVTQPHLRGALSASSSFAVIIGVLCQFLLGTFLHWRTVALINCVIPTLAFIFLLFVPESPHWLIMKRRFDEAQKSLAWLRGWTTVDDIQAEYQELCDHYHGNTIHIHAISVENDVNSVNNNSTIHEEAKRPKKSFFKARLEGSKNFAKKSFLWPLSMVSFIYFLTHFTGSTTLQTYAVQLFAVLQAPINKYYATIMLGVAELIGCVLCIYLIQRFGKRVSAFISITGTALCAIATASYAQVINVKYFNILAKNTTEVKHDLPDPAMESYKWLPLASLIGLAFLAHCCARALPWILIGEIYPKETRATGCGISGAISYIFGFFANKLFLKMVAAFTIPGVYFFYGAMGFFGVIVLYFIMPETEGKTLQEICDHFAGVSKLDNKVRRKKRRSAVQGRDNTAFDAKTELHKTDNFESKL